MWNWYFLDDRKLYIFCCAYTFCIWWMSWAMKKKKRPLYKKRSPCVSRYLSYLFSKSPLPLVKKNFDPQSDNHSKSLPKLIKRGEFYLRSSHKSVLQKSFGPTPKSHVIINLKDSLIKIPVISWKDRYYPAFLWHAENALISGIFSTLNNNGKFCAFLLDILLFPVWLGNF